MQPGYTIAYQNLTGLEAGQTYLVSGWVRASSAANQGVSLILNGAAGGQGASLTPGTSWQPISLPYTVGADGALQINLVANAGSSGTFDWDDITVSAGAGASAAAANAQMTDPLLWGSGSNADVWSNTWFSSLAPSQPAKEYIRLNGQVIAVENHP